MSNLKGKLSRLASDQPSNWKAKAKHRRENREWLKKSATKIALGIQIIDDKANQGRNTHKRKPAAWS